MVKADIPILQIDCDLPNACIIDVATEVTTRFFEVYAPDSKSWNWDQLSPFVSENSVIYGDFNVNPLENKVKADTLLSWSDFLNLGPFYPSELSPSPSSRRTLGTSTHWKVFSLFLELSGPFWTHQWNCGDLGSTYESYVMFLRLLIAPCTSSLPLEKYRIALSQDLRCLMSYVRALSFRQMRSGDMFLKLEVRRIDPWAAGMASRDQLRCGR